MSTLSNYAHCASQSESLRGAALADETRTVFVSGVGGYIGGHIAKRLMSFGFKVRGTVRNASNAQVKYKYLFDLQTKKDQLSLFSADLTKDEGWRDAVAGSDLAIHTANVMPGNLQADGSIPVSDDDFCIPAREGMLRVLRACKEARIHKVVYLSSIGAMNWELWDKTKTPKNGVVISTGADWTPLNESTYVPPYIKSKTIAEKTFWEFVNSEDSGMEGATCHPTLVIGPVLHARKPDSLTLIEALLDGQYPVNIDVHWSIVDVRDVAAGVHLALVSPESSGNRYMLSGDGMFQKDISSLLSDKFGGKGYPIPTMVGPSFIPRFLGLIDPLIRDFVVPILDVTRFVDVTPSRKDLGLIYTPSYYTIIQAAESLIDYDLVKPPHSQLRRTVTSAAVTAAKVGAVVYAVSWLDKNGFLDAVKEKAEELKNKLSG